MPKSKYASQDWYDLWYPNPAPSPETVKFALYPDAGAMDRLFRKYRAEMATPGNAHSIALLAALSHHCDFSVGKVTARMKRTATARRCGTFWHAPAPGW
ncbi:MAG: hypothetical protein U1F35_13265 [Steroidobacteraceae bacterium]